MITDNEHLSNLIAAAFHRELEVYQYQLNIDNYASMLTALPAGEWPTHLVDYKAATIESLPWDMSDEDIDAVGDYQYRDRLRSLIRTERVEQGKARRVLDALKAQIGEDYAVLLDQYKAAQSV